MEELKYNIEMLQMADNKKDYDGNLTEEDIENYKEVNRIFSKAESIAKLPHCVLCEKEW